MRKTEQRKRKENTEEDRNARRGEMEKKNEIRNSWKAFITKQCENV